MGSMTPYCATPQTTVDIISGMRLLKTVTLLMWCAVFAQAVDLRNAVIVVRPEDGGLFVVRRFAGKPTAAEIRHCLRPPSLATPPMPPVFSVPIQAAPVFRGRSGGC